MTTDSNSKNSVPEQPAWRFLITRYLPWDVIASIIAYFILCHREVDKTAVWFMIMLLLSVVTLKIRRMMWQMQYRPAR